MIGTFLIIYTSGGPREAQGAHNLHYVAEFQYKNVPCILMHTILVKCPDAGFMSIIHA